MNFEETIEGLLKRLPNNALFDRYRDSIREDRLDLEQREELHRELGIVASARHLEIMRVILEYRSLWTTVGQIESAYEEDESLRSFAATGSLLEWTKAKFAEIVVIHALTPNTAILTVLNSIDKFHRLSSFAHAIGMPEDQQHILHVARELEDLLKHKALTERNLLRFQDTP